MNVYASYTYTQNFSLLWLQGLPGHYYSFTLAFVMMTVLIGLCLFCCLVNQATKRQYPNNIVFSIIMWYFRMHLMKPRVWLIRHMRNHSLSGFFRFFFMRHILSRFKCEDSLFLVFKYFHVWFCSFGFAFRQQIVCEWVLVMKLEFVFRKMKKR